MSGLTFDPGDHLKKLTEHAEKRAYALEALGRTFAAKMQKEAAAKHPWQNRTHFAERGLAGRAERRGDLTRITLSHGVRYGVYLELAMGKRFAHLWPTIKRFAPEILRAVAKIGGGR